MTEQNDPDFEKIRYHTNLVMTTSNEFGNAMHERFDEIAALTDKFQTELQGLDVMNGIGAGVQLILHGCSQLAEQNFDRVPSGMSYETLFVLYVNAVMVNACETADNNATMQIGRA